MEAAVDVFYFEVKVLSAGKRGEMFVGLLTGDSPAIDPQLLASIREGKVRDGPLDTRRGTNGRGGEDSNKEDDDDDDDEQSVIELPTPSFVYDRLWQPGAASQSAASHFPLSSVAAPPIPYSSSAQRQLGLEHPHSFGIQLSHGRLYSQQHSKGLSCLPSFAVGETLGIGYVHNALTSTAVSSAAVGGIAATNALTVAGTSAQPLPASSLTVSSYVFFTKNGRLIPDKELSMDHINALLAQSNQSLSTSASPLPALLFPAVSFHSPSESLQAAFSPSSFLFDLAQYEAELRDRRLQLLAAVEDGKSGLLSLVREYLLCWGYDGTVAVLDESEVVEVDARLRWAGAAGVAGGGGVEGGKSSMADRLLASNETALRSSLRMRGEIRQLIQSADVEAAVRRIRQLCPAALRQRTVRFHLHSLHFINLLTAQPAAAQHDAAASPVLNALHYARRHLSPYLTSASLSPTLARLMALLALPPTEWSSSRLTGIEWRERVADVVNRAVLQLSSQSANSHNGEAGSRQSGRGSKQAHSDPMHDGDERTERGKGERRERDGGGTRSDEFSKNGMEVEHEDGLFGVEEAGNEQDEASDDDDDEVAEEETDNELHGSQLELLLAQLLAVNSLWQHQRPALSDQQVLPHDALEQLLMQR